MFQKIIFELCSFFSFLLREKISFLTFILTFLLFLFLPGQDSYWQARIFWQPPQVGASSFSLPELPPYPIVRQDVNLTPLDLNAKAFLIFDPVSCVVLSSCNENLKLPPASTTKIMTALVAFEAYSLDQVLTVPEFFVEGHKIKLVPGEKITAGNLLMAVLIGSANDAAEVLAYNYPQGRRAFIEKMNEKAKSLLLKNTHFENPTGIDEPGHFSTAFDLARLSKYALENEVFARFVSYPKMTISSVNGQIVHSFENTNILLSEIPGVSGIKTGWTENAGECLISLVERDGRKIISVVLGSPDRFGETKKIIEWVFGNFEWKNPEHF